MKTMLLESIGKPLRYVETPTPVPNEGQVLLKVNACGICRTDLHVLEGDLPNPKIPLILGHEVVGTVVDKGAQVEQFNIGQRLGVPWLGHTCGSCKYCNNGRENLCDQALFTGYTLNGGFAEYIVADQRYCFLIPDIYSDAEAAPLLCAGLIGYRALVAAENAQRLGIYGFGAAAHIITQVASAQKREVYAFTKPGDIVSQKFAMEMGAVWSGNSDRQPPKEMEAAIIFAPVGSLIPMALSNVTKGGKVICAGIHMSDIPAFPYAILWGEREVCSIANLTRDDGEKFFNLAPKLGVQTKVKRFNLSQANEAIQELQQGKIKGAAVLIMN
ncbi:MAG TPA: zinc-dependent alcohol dehydrogenase family protein [Methylophilaceae bacterium]|nr:zinc-dependent alcohol dehydrogenase family protein [Methylophilaceae bacterium]